MRESVYHWMTDTPLGAESGIQPEIEEIISGFGHLTISPAPSPPSNHTKIQRKTNYIRLYVDFKYLNQACLKSNYPLPNMENILQELLKNKYYI